MEITGRLTANATVNKTAKNNEVVNFSIVINDRYKTKDGEQKELTSYVRCAYWLSSAVEPHLQKGKLVQLSGRISVNAWNDAEGKAKASLDFHVNSIRFLSGTSKTTQSEEVTASPVSENLPF